jgi:YD repeat-containing protein
MARQWLSFLREKTRGMGRASPSDADIYVPFGQGKLARGDSVYRVAVVEGELWFFGRVIVGRTAEDPEHDESLDVWAEPGTETTWCEDECEVDERVVDELVYLDADGTPHRMPRDASGRLDGEAFRGSSSILELADGGKALDQLAER